MKKNLFLFSTFLLISCTDVKKIEKEIADLKEENLSIIDIQGEIYKSNVELLDAKIKMQKLTINNEDKSKVNEIQEMINENLERTKKYSVKFKNNGVKIDSLSNLLK